LSHLSGPRQSHFDERNDRILVADQGNRRILEIEYPSEDVSNTLSSTATGDFGRIYAARYNPFNGNLIVTDHENHYVVETNWDGDVIKDFGVYGTAGSDSSHLDSPRYADIGPFGNNYYIADKGNDRVLQIARSDMTFASAFLIPDPITGKRMKDNCWMFGSRSQGGYYGYGPLRRVVHTGCWKIERWKDRLQASSFFDLLEWDYRYGSYAYRETPISDKMLDDHSLDANASVERPFLPWDMDRAVITVHSDQDATLDIKTLQPPSGAGHTYIQNKTDEWPPEYRNYDSISITGGTSETYVISNPQPCMAWEVTMGGTAGTVNLKVDMR